MTQDKIDSLNLPNGDVVITDSNYVKNRRLFKSYMRVLIYPNLDKIYEEAEAEAKVNNRVLNKNYKSIIAEKYPPIVINRYPDEFTCTCSITSSIQENSQMVLTVVNLSAYQRMGLLNNKYTNITVQAGYLGHMWKPGEKVSSSDIKIVFKGVILWMGTSVEARKNITTQFTCISLKGQQGLTSEWGNTMNVMNYGAGYNVHQLIREIYLNSNNPDIKLNLSEEDRDTLIGTTNSGADKTSMTSILSSLNTNISYNFEGTEEAGMDMWLGAVSPGVIYGNVHHINEETGLIGMPSLQDNNIKFKMLFNNSLKVNQHVKLNNYDIQLPLVDSTSDANKAYSGNYLDQEGIYRVIRITWTLNTRGSEFYMEVEAVANNMYSNLINNTSESPESDG